MKSCCPRPRPENQLLYGIVIHYILFNIFCVAIAFLVWLGPLGLGCRERGRNNWGFEGCLASLPRNQPSSAFFALFQGGRRAPEKARKRIQKAFVFSYPWICLTPPLLNPYTRHSRSWEERNVNDNPHPPHRQRICPPEYAIK